MKFKFEWVNGSEIVEGKNHKEACGNIKTNPNKITTGYLVRFKTLYDRMKIVKKGLRDWQYWDVEMFWKYLKGGKNGKRKR